VCIFPDTDDHGMYVTTAYDDILSPLEGLVKLNQDQLRGSEEDFDSHHKADEQSDKRAWWKRRTEADDGLCKLMEQVDRKWFGSKPAQRVLHGESNQSSECANLASLFEAASLEETAPRGMNVNNDHETPCTLLVLDENLHRFPFEGLPSLQGRVVSRLPSLPFVLPRLESQVVKEKTSYILDPQSNLSDTTGRLLPFLESISETAWNGVVREAPTREFMEESLLTNGLLLYFGHGSGQAHFSRVDIENLLHQGRPIRAAVILMGCSSGRLESVNRKNSNVMDELPIYYEPEGIALTYLAAGAPCVIGNLWDVTDRDIDRFSIAMLERFYDKDSSLSLAACVAQARSFCKMQSIVGCAPVCYGVPTFGR
jgi:hypothetical protein